jgi:hypothetical protein
MGTNGVLSLSEHILEIRFKPNPKILDHRGAWAELVSKELSLSEWLILDNRFDVHDKPKKETVFVGFRNCGYTCFDAPTANYFPDKAIKFFKLLLDLEEFGNPLFVERIGVRSKFITSHPKGFDDLKERYASRYLILSEKAKQAIGGKLVDIGGPLNFADKLGNFNTVSGPMAKDQMKDFIKREGEYPDVGLFYDIDYWQRPNKDLQGSDVLSMIRSFATEAWNRHSRVRDLICGD